MHESIYLRKSVRRFKPDAVPKEHIEACLKAATYAPSGKNAQNWHFVVVSDATRIQAVADAIGAANEEYCSYTSDPAKQERFRKMLPVQTLFKGAPVLILAYASEYLPSALEILKEKNPTPAEVQRLLKHSPGVQNVSAAFENLLLAAAELGYGTCWMTAPVYAEDAINKALDLHLEGFYLACVTPLGVPADGNHPQPARRPLEDVVTWIEPI